MAQLDDQQRLLEQLDMQTAALTDFCHRVAVNLSTPNFVEKDFVLRQLQINAIWPPDDPLWLKASIPLEIYNEVYNIDSSASCCAVHHTL